MSSIDTCFDRTERAIEAKEPEKNEADLNEWAGAGEGTEGLGTTRTKAEGKVWLRPAHWSWRRLVWLEQEIQDQGRSKISTMNESTEARSRSFWIPLQPHCPVLSTAEL